MQVKKFEAPTLQEALDTIKRELGPEAIILQTKQNRRGFGLMSKASVEVTAAVSERAIDKKKTVEKKLPDAYTQKINSAPAKNQADFYENYLDKKIEKEKVELSKTKKITAVRYADIEDEPGTEREVAQAREVSRAKQAEAKHELPQYSVPNHMVEAIENYQNLKVDGFANLQEEVANLKRLVEEMRRERKKPEYIDSDSPFSATDALQGAYEMLLQSGVERRFAVQIMREVGRILSVEARADQDAVLDSVADQLLKKINSKNFFETNLSSGEQEVSAFIGVGGAGKTALLAKLTTHSVRTRNEKVGVIRVQLASDEGTDPLSVFAKALHIPYRLVSSPEELQVALQDMSQCQRVMIDTQGVSVRDEASVKKLHQILGIQSKISTTRIKINLVLSCTTRDLELQNQAKVFSIFNPSALMFTRLDEAFSFGVIYSLSNRLRLPVSVFSTGRKVTEEWENATPERLTASILNIL